MIFEDILYEERDSTAYISINRPQVMNAFRGRTMDELLHAIMKAGWDKKIASIVLTGTGDRAFCTGGDQLRTQVSTTDAAPSDCRSKKCTARSATCPSR